MAGEMFIPGNVNTFFDASEGELQPFTPETPDAPMVTEGNFIARYYPGQGRYIIQNEAKRLVIVCSTNNTRRVNYLDFNHRDHVGQVLAAECGITRNPPGSAEGVTVRFSRFSSGEQSVQIGLVTMLGEVLRLQRDKGFLDAARNMALSVQPNQTNQS